MSPRLLLVLAGLSGLVVGLLLLGMMSGGEDGQPVRLPPRPAGSERPEPSMPDTAPAINAAQSPAPAGRDPFVQLVTEPGARAGDQAAAAPPRPPAEASPPSTAGPAAADVSPASGQGPSPSSGASGSSAEQPANGGGEAALELQAIATDETGVERAIIVVDGQTFSPAVGEVFSYGFRLERIAGSCVEASSGAARATMCLPDG